MQHHDAIEFDLRVACSGDGSFYMLGCEDNLWKLLRLQDFLFHLVVARLAAAVTRRSIHDEFAARGAGCIIELHGTALQREPAMHRMQHVPESEVDLTLRWIGHKCPRFG